VELTGIARIPLGMLRYAEGRGIARAALLRESGLREEWLADPDRRLPLARIESLWRVLIARIPDPALGLHMAGSLGLRDLGLVGYTMAYSPTLERALLRLVRYGRVVSEALCVEFDTTRGEVRIEGAPSITALRHPADLRLALLVGALREATGFDVVPIEVRLPYPRPTDTREHERVFRCPLRFGAPDSAVLVRPEDRARPVSTADETLARYLERLADQALRAITAADTWSSKVKRAIWSELSDGRPGLARAARALGVSARTLQRRLRDERTSFAGVLEEFRRDVALGLLRDRELAVYEIAFLLGYAEPSTFHRAFRRWHGASPHEFRRRLDASAPPR
jgi:AraC-like DNA-binding protein